MNPDFPQNPRDEMEQRLTALLLGELSAEEAAAVHRTMEQDGELAKLFARLHRTVGLVRQTVASPGEPVAPLKLSAARREKLLAQFKTIAPSEFTPLKRRTRLTLVELAAIVVILGVLAAISFPTLSKFGNRSPVASASLDAELAGEIAFEPAKTHRGEKSERAPTALGFRTWSSTDSAEPLGRSATLSADFAGSEFDADAAAKRPIGLTPLSSKPSAATPGEDRGHFVTGSTASANDALTLGDKPELGESFYRFNPDSAATARGRLPQLAGPVASGQPGKAEEPEPPLTENIPVQYANPWSVAAALESFTDDRWDNRGLTRGHSVDAATGLPIAGPGDLDAGSAQPVETRTSNVRPEVLYQGGLTGGGGGSAGRSSFRFVTNSLAGTPAVERFYSDLGVNLDAKAGKSVSVRATPEGLDQLEQINEVLAMKPPETNIKTKLAELAQNENRALGFDWYAINKDALTGQAGTTVSGANQPARDWLDRGEVTTSSRRAGTVAVSSVPDGGRIAPEPNLYSLDVAGYANVPPPPADSTSRTSSAMTRRAPAAIVLPDSQVTERSPREQIARAGTTAVESRLQESQTELAENRSYSQKLKELQDEMDVRQLLARKLNIEKIDLSLPKSAQVEIVENANANAAPNQSAWGNLRNVVSGEVQRVAQIKVEQDKSDIAEFSDGRASGRAYDPYFVQTESETIQSEAVLGKVVAELKLDELWAKQKGTGAKLKTNEAIAMLRGRLELRPVPNTTLMEIRAKSSQPEEAAKIANAVAENYQRWGRERELRLVTGGIAELEQQIAMQDEEIQQTKAELERLRVELKISDAEAGVIETDLTPVRQPATNAPIPQPEIPTSENNFSTFSLNVSDVSFKLAAASLEQGQMPDMASVRSEEFINALDYRDPEPQAGAPIAFTGERARYPFAHNRDLLRFSLKTAAAGRQAGRPLNIVLLLDNSGSMERADRVHIIREALRVLASQLQPQDKLSVITFSRTARLVADGISGAQAAEVAEQVSAITPQGGTNLEAAMDLAYLTAARHYLANGINRVVLLTDGAANLGAVEPESLKQKVEVQRQQGIALDCFGIGWEGLNDDLLEVLSRNGDGRYGFINSPEEAATDFVGQLAGALQVAASDVKVQVEFNPKRVTSYRQIGYAKHQLTKEQFRDNTVDAAEIAAQEAGTALYTVAVNPVGAGPLGTVRVRYKIPGTATYREQAWDVPFTGKALSLDQSSPALRLAATASAFSEWLVASPFAGEVTPDALLGYLRGVPEVYGADPRPKKLEWMIRQAKSVAGK